MDRKCVAENKDHRPIMGTSTTENDIEIIAEYNTLPMNASVKNENRHIGMDQRRNSTKPQTVVNKVYVNPNYKNIKPVIHINPDICGKPSIHINPRIIDINAQSRLQNDEKKNETVNIQQNSDIGKSVKTNSIYVNPQLMKKLSSSSTLKQNNIQLKKTSPEVSYCVYSKLKLVRNGTVTKKNSPTSSNFVALSKSKLIRVQKSPKVTNVNPLIKSIIKAKKSISPARSKTKVDNRLIGSSNVVNQLSSSNTLKLLKPHTKIAINKYKVDRTIPLKIKTKKQITNLNRIRNESMNLVSIRGVLYKSSGNQLIKSVLNTSTMKKKRNITHIKNEQFFVAKNGKKLCRLDLTKKNLCIKKSCSIKDTKMIILSSKMNHKKYISDKVKQKSLQILRNKLKKNNQPCLIFQKFGFCTNEKKGKCPKVHDKKQVALCKKFLQGKCLANNCKLSHDVGPEKMPTCKYFLEGCCVRDSCPYLHVKVSDNTPICQQFLRGYCEKANECKERHIFACPEFDKTETCRKGKYCPYPHKSRLSTVKKSKSDSRKPNIKKSEVQNKKPVSDASTMQTCIRYYDESQNRDLHKVKDDLLRKVNIMKDVHAACCSSTKESALNNDICEPVRESDQEVSENNQNDNDNVVETEWPKRKPLGPLPAYIPIN